MELTRALTYDAPKSRVVAMLRDPGFWDRVADATGATSSATTVTEGNGAVEVVTDQDQRVTGVPAFAKKFVGETTRAVIRRTWRGDAADYVVETPGSPVSIAGSASVSDRGDQTVVTYDLTVRCAVPLVGRKLEALVCDLTGDGLDSEHQVGRDWLAG